MQSFLTSYAYCVIKRLVTLTYTSVPQDHNKISSLSILHKFHYSIVPGTLIGLIQIPIVFSVGDTLGGSSAYCTILSKGLSVTGFLSNTTFQYFKKFSRGMDNWWQVIYRWSCSHIG